ncbi:MAG: prepilin-type N-terminal cleavage/methylation domain-containing protein [Calditrichaeota bacterium]|nr:prepilin-type N-terminal cleavage/methylation domain-containing protein [Calditrichota bacterium]
MKRAKSHSTRRQPGWRQLGFSLLEVILVVVLIAIAIPPLLRLFSHSILGSVDSELRTKATLYAQEKLEQILNDKKVAGGFQTVITPGRYPPDVPEEGFTRTVQIQSDGLSYNGVPYARVVVTVSHAGIPDVQLETWITNY